MNNENKDIGAVAAAMSIYGAFCSLENKKEYDIDKIRERGYTVLVFNNGELLIFPVSRLPEDLQEGDEIELTVRRHRKNG